MRGDNLRKILTNFTSLKELIAIANAAPINNWHEHWSLLDDMPGIGISTYSKFLYFLNSSICGYKALILDGNIINILSSKIFIDFYDLSIINHYNAGDKYPLYLKKNG